MVDGYIGRSTSHISDHDTLKQLPNPSKSRLAMELVDIFQQSCQQNDVLHLQARFHKVPKSLMQCIVSVTEVRSQEIYEEARKRSILSGLPDSLQDFDWSLRVCSGFVNSMSQKRTKWQNVRNRYVVIRNIHSVKQ